MENLNQVGLTKSCCIIDYSNVFAKDRHSLLCGFIYQNLLILDFCQTPTNPMQPPFSRWFNPDKRCDVMMGSSTISSEQFQELQELSPEVGEQETSIVCEGWCHWLYCPPNIIKMTCDRECLAKHRYCQKSLFKNGDELSIILLWNSAFLFWDHISSFNETCLAFVFLLFLKSTDVQHFILTKYFDQTPTCDKG